MNADVVVIIVFSILFSGLFSGLELAYISANRLRITLDAKQGNVSGKLLAFFLKRPGRFIGTMLLGNNIVLVIYGIFMAAWLEPWIFSWWQDSSGVLLVQTLISTFVILVFGEFLPKAIFSTNPNGMLKVLAVPIFVIYWLLWIPTIVIIGISELFLRVFTGKTYSREDLTFGRIDLQDLVRESTEQNEKQNDTEEHKVEIFKNALDFSKLKARDCFIPRTEITAIDAESDVEELKTLFLETGYSKILVFRDTIDNIIGYVHSWDMFSRPKTITALLRPLPLIPETMTADDILKLLLDQRKGMAVVVDEYGGTAGLVSIEDIMEQIFGEIEDEHDHEELLESQIDEHSFHFSSRLEVDYVNKTYSLNLPANESYETLAGMVMHLTGNIPNEGEIIDLPGYRITILQNSQHKIDAVRIDILSENS